jgi:ecdysone 20-monooxygenase
MNKIKYYIFLIFIFSLSLSFPQTVVLCHNWVACTDERNFVHADQYIPERWLPEEAASKGLTPSAPFLVAPYGYSRRMCPGKKFAEQQLNLFTAKVRSFNL